MKQRERNPLRAENVVCFDGSFRTALHAFRSAGEEPVLLVADAADQNALTIVGQARAAGVVTESIVHRSALGPLGRAVLAQLGASLTQRTDAGTVLAVLAEAERRTRTLVLVDSPAKLHRPTPTLWQHLWGLLPGSCFAGELNGRVTAIGHRGLPPSLEKSLHSPDTVLHMSAPDEARALRRETLDQLVAAVSPWRSVTHPAADTHSAAWWGPRSPIELCLFPADVESIIREVHSRAILCPWCGLTAASGTCAVCGSAVTASRQGADPPLPPSPPGIASSTADAPADRTTEGLPA